MDFKEALKSNLQRAVETNSPGAIEALDKNETVFYLCNLVGVEPPEDHPSEHNGTVSRALAQRFAFVLGDYVDRNGNDAFDPDAIPDAGEDTDESDEEGDSDGEGDA